MPDASTFDETLPLEGYCLRVIVIYPDLKKLSAKSDAVDSSIIGLTEKVDPLGIEFSIPKGATHFLVCVRVGGIEQGRLCSALSSTGMRMVEVGRV